MLVLARKMEERIQIGQDITVTILRIKGQTVKVGIEAPEGTYVLRGELLRRVDEKSAPSPAKSEVHPIPEGNFSPPALRASGRRHTVARPRG